MLNRRLALTIRLAVIAITGLLVGCEPTGQSTQPAYHRIINTGTIRAAYVSYPPGTIVSPGSGDPSGIMVDVLNESARRLGLSVDYTEEVGWGTMIEGLNSGRYEVVAAPTWANPTRSKQALFSTPLFYSVVGIWMRADDNRAEDPSGGWASLNQPGVRIASLDGSTMIGIVETQFPDAELVTYPDLLGEPHIFQELTSGKVDAFFAEPVTGYYFQQSNPGAIKNVASERPLRAFPDVYVLPKDEPQWQNMLNTAIKELLNSGYVDDIISQYEPTPNAFYRVARGYVVPR
jgi:cyclohexadienyl dehydratase